MFGIVETEIVNSFKFLSILMAYKLPFFRLFLLKISLLNFKLRSICFFCLKTKYTLKMLVLGLHQLKNNIYICLDVTILKHTNSICSIKYVKKKTPQETMHH